MDISKTLQILIPYSIFLLEITGRGYNRERFKEFILERRKRSGGKS
jgi:hypothetical protein